MFSHKDTQKPTQKTEKSSQLWPKKFPVLFSAQKPDPNKAKQQEGLKQKKKKKEKKLKMLPLFRR
jgi:hypothetical protein